LPIKSIDTARAIIRLCEELRRERATQSEF
jgi:hypothetical protein